MKKLLLLFTAIVLISPVFSQTSDKKWGVGLGAGPYLNLEQDGIGLSPEAYLSRYLSPRFDLMLKGDLGVFHSKLDNPIDFGSAALNLRLKLSDESKKFRPYLYAGPGILKNSRESNVNFDLGLGAKYYFSPATALYVNAGYINGIEVTKPAGNVRESFLKATIGIEFDFGKKKDSDMDGVADSRDKCPDTPAGVKVDADGCPVDTDGDSVPDHLDDCPTVAGVPALKGCPDKDGDGIADNDDQCPDVAGPKALKGCPDSDGDGVADKDDKCSDTPKGWKVDKNGCPLDSDGDGIVDAEDACPDVPGVPEEKGCPAKKAQEKKEVERVPVKLDKKIEPVYFVFDKSYITDYSKKKLDNIVSILKNNPDYLLNVYGHTDNIADEDYNKNLSQKRVDSVIEYLTSKGISASRIKQTKAYGKSKPVEDNSTAKGRQLNRRVEFEITK